MSTTKTLSRLSIASLVTLLLVLAAIGTVWAQTPTDDRLERGARLFAQNCAVCHGANGEGRVGATLAKNWPSIRPDLTVKTIIENGVPGSPMPAWSQTKGGPLSPAQIDDLVYFILSWQIGGPPQITPSASPTPRPLISPVPEVEGDPNQGGVLFDQNCAVCHGVNGEGRIGATLAKDWPSIRPDLAIKATIQNGIPGSPMPAWSQANGGPLNESQINDLVAFILSWESLSAAPLETEAPSSTPGWLAGWGGILLTVVLLTIVLAAVLLLQRSSPA